MEALSDCPYWGFILPSSRPLKKRDEHVGSYKSLVGKHSFLSKGGCPYWEQYKSYISSDVIVLNSSKWEIEAWIGRLPSTDITIIDEADAWLDGLCSKVNVTEKKIKYLLNKLGDEGMPEKSKRIRESWNDYKSGFADPLPLAEELHDVLSGLDLGINLYWQLDRVLKFKDEIVSEEEEKKIVFYIPDPRPVLSELRDRIGGKFLMMSATVQNPEVLENVYGIDPVFVEGEVNFPGKLVRKKVGSEMKVNNRRWKISRFRRKYAEIRDEILKRAKRPGFVPVHATKYLPNNVENITDKDQGEVEGLTFSTKMDRGADLEEMESVVILKYPFPSLGDPLLKATKKKLGDAKFWMYYRDMSRREFIQQVGRTIRSPDDEVEFWSPDAKCHERLKQDWEGTIVEGSKNNKKNRNYSG
jgi:Rad3-related DNA helicase